VAGRAPHQGSDEVRSPGVAGKQPYTIKNVCIQATGLHATRCDAESLAANAEFEQSLLSLRTNKWLRAALTSASVLQAHVFDMRQRVQDTKDAMNRIPVKTIPVRRMWPTHLSKASEYLSYIAIGTGLLTLGPITFLMIILWQLMHFIVSVTGPLSEVLHIPVRLMSEEEDVRLRATYLEPGTPAYAVKMRAQQRIQERLQRESKKYTSIDKQRQLEAAQTSVPAK